MPSFVTASPESIGITSADVSTIGVTMASNNEAAAGPTVSVLPPGMDAVSLLSTLQLAAHAQTFQAMAAQLQLAHQEFAKALGLAQAAYAVTEVANAAGL